ncbi:MAG: DNA-directed DNA polymerase I [Promethearchaeota archaeon]|nr:MAG: DNA-directed DNA polymerase I [Candidatus Lokiarchaeota archaeon]
MAGKKKSKKKKEEDLKQKSLFSYVESSKSEKMGEEEEERTLDEETEELQDISEEFEEDAEMEVEVVQDQIYGEDIIKFKKAKVKSPSEIIPIPQDLFFKGNDKPFGLKEGNIKLEKISRESVTSKYIRYLIQKGEIVQNLERGLLLDVDYDGTQNKAYCKFYDLDTGEVKIWIDTTNHEPYCLSKEPISELKKNKELIGYDGFQRFEEIKRMDLLSDKEIKMTKIYGKTPINIGGSGTNIKNILAGNDKKAWEADIRYHLNYIFDRQLIPGLIYSIENGTIKKVKFKESEDESKKITQELHNLFKDESIEIQEFSEKFLDIFLTPIPDVKRMAMDIEVNIGEHDYRVPDPRQAKQEIISISFVATDGLKRVYILEREGFTYSKPHKNFPADAEVVFYKSEKALLTETFRILWKYPIVITFNGDNFDLNYMFHRADKLKISRDLNPIHVKRGFGILSKAECDLRKGVHIDLFNFFFNRSISGYAFGGAYESSSLNAISDALLGKEKYQHEEEIHEMEYNILSWYNLKDSLLTLELTKFNSSLVWNLIILLCRITKMPIHEMVRRQISTWIQNIFYFEHRRRGFLIPRRAEISELKKGGFKKSVIEGKGFQGAYVISPVPGIHYDVVVMDFASLYPSIIKEYNLSYETVLCPHEDCKDNLLRNTPYHTCTHKMGIFAYVVGFFRDIRVKYFKPKSSDKALSEKQRNYYNTIQQALKVFINGSYGVFGSQNFPLFCLPVAESTTSIGQYSIKQTIKKSEEIGVKVLYGDTDSVFLLNPSKDQMSKLSHWSKQELDLDLEEEKTYQFLALSERKKNYVGIYKDSKYVDIKGLVAKKKNTPDFIKKVFSHLLEILKNVTNNEEFSKAKKEIIEIVRDNLKKIGKSDAFSLEDYAINIALQKSLSGYDKVIPQHVRAALELKKATGKEFQKGETVTFIKTKGGNGAKAIELASLQDIDIKKYKELLRSALEQILDALGISFDEIKGIKKMDAFF